MTASLHPRGLWLPAALMLAALATGPLPGSPLPSPGDEGIRHPSKLPRTDHRHPGPATPASPPAGTWTELPGEVRRIDGTGNNRSHPNWGATDAPLLRMVPAAYGDGIGSPAGEGRPSAREISNSIAAQAQSIPNRRGASDFLWQWGQFLDHDIDLTPTIDPVEAFDIPVPAGDRWFDPRGTGAMTIPLDRSYYEVVDGVRQQINAITAYIDASNVYGSDQRRAAALRSLDGSGKLKTTPSTHGDLLPYNEAGLDNAMGTSPHFFLAGDVRANEQVALTAMHTLFVREHNFWADKFAALNPDADDEEIYQFARMIVAAEMQCITYREFLPVLLGRHALRPYRGYNPRVDAGIANVFSTGAYRLGHSLLSPTLLRPDADGNESAAGHLPLADAFFTPAEIEDHGIDGLLRGLAAQRCQELDGFIVDDVRNMLFGPPGSGGFDLAALNMQRGRDHGLPSYVDVCRDLGQPPARDFREINPDPAVWESMAAVYDDVRDVDCWIGGLCESHVRGSMVGPMMHRILVDQFTRLRDGDRFYYRNHLPKGLARLVEAQSLATIIRRNTGIGAELPDNVFIVRKGKRPPRTREKGRTRGHPAARR